MPIYRATCDCGHTEDVFKPVKDYEDMPMHCGKKMQRQICAPMVIADIQPYRSMATGEMIGGRAQHKEHLKRHGLIELGNEKITPKKAPEAPTGIKADIANVMNGMGL
jgi:hypothetical protein